MGIDFTFDLRMKEIDAKIETIRQNIQAMGILVASRTEELRRAHNNLVRQLKEKGQPSETEAPSAQPAPRQEPTEP